MAYGLYIQSGNSTLQIDSSRPLRYFKVTSAGVGASVTVPNLTDIVFMKPGSFASSQNWGSQRTGSAGSYTYTFYANGVASNASYMVCRPTSVSAPSNTGYGLVVYNSDGQLAFDSGTFISATVSRKTAEVVQVFDKGALYGDGSSTMYSASDYQDVYCCINSSYMSGINTNIDCFRYDITAQKITYIYKWLFTFIVFGYNPGSVIIARLKA